MNTNEVHSQSCATRRAYSAEVLGDVDAQCRPAERGGCRCDCHKRSLLISWLGWEDGLVNQDLVRVRKYRPGEIEVTPEEMTVSIFASDPKVARIVKVETR